MKGAAVSSECLVMERHGPHCTIFRAWPGQLVAANHSIAMASRQMGAGNEPVSNDRQSPSMCCLVVSPASSSFSEK